MKDIFCVAYCCREIVPALDILSEGFDGHGLGLGERRDIALTSRNEFGILKHSAEEY